MMNDDMALLREFAAGQSERAFETLVARHIHLVHSAALRQTRDPHLAEEITQAVFIILARKAGSLAEKTILSGWLYRTAQYASADALKVQRRRQRREQEAYMQSIQENPETESAWLEISPLLDEAMTKLGQTDRDAVVLRYFENKSLREVGGALGLQERAAQKRIARALEKLRKFFVKCGVSSTAAIIAEVISANSVQAAPTMLMKTITAAAMTKGIAASGSTLTLIKTTLKIMAWTKMKTAVAVGAVILLAAGTTTMVVQHQRYHLPKPQPVIAGQTEFPKESWHFAGYADPESAYLSIMWAFRNGDTRTLLASMTPDMQKKLEGETVLTAKDKADVANMTGYRILDKQMLSDNEVVFDVETDGEGQGTSGTHTSKFYLQRVGDEWKFSGQPRK